MSNTKNTIGLVVVAVIAIIGLFIASSKPVAVPSPSKTVGGTSNLDDLGIRSLKLGTSCGDEFTYAACAGTSGAPAAGIIMTTSNIFRGGILSTSTPLSMTMTGTDLQYSVISVLPTIGSITMTLPASTTITSTFLPNAGDATDLLVHNASSTAGIKLTLAGGSGTLVEVSTSTAATTFVIQPLGTARISAYRKANTDYVFYGAVSQ